MLANNRASAVLVSTDLERSQRFYEDKVGLELSPETIKNHLLFECGDGTSLLVYGRAAGNKADHTQVRFWTDDVDSDVRELESRGATFEGDVVEQAWGSTIQLQVPGAGTLMLFEPKYEPPALAKEHIEPMW